MIKKTGIIFFTLLSSIAFGQTQSMNPGDMEELFEKNRFAATWPYYEALLKADVFNSDLNFKVGVCYLNSRSQKEKAIMYFNKALILSDAELSEQVVTYKLLGEACYYASNFDQAIANYKKHEKILLAANDDSPYALEEINMKISICKIGKELKTLKTLTDSLANQKIKLADNRSNIDSSRVDSLSASPVIAISPAILKLNRYNALSDKDFFEDGEISTEVKNPGPSKKTDSNNGPKEATIATSVDGQIILIYRNIKGNCILYTSGLKGNEWTNAEILSKNLDNIGWEPNEYISPDGNTLYFSLKRDGGFGGKDLYKCIKLTNGEWGKAINLGPTINTPYDEEAPYIHTDGVTLYFSSNRFKTKGGSDIFTCSLADTGILALPLSVGYPFYETVNTTTVSHVQPATKKEKSIPGKENPDDKKDNCMVTLIDQKRTPLIIMKGKITEANGKIPRYTEITITNNITGEICGIYHSDRETGQYAFILEQGKNNNITYQAEEHMFHSENLNITKETSYYKSLHPIQLVPMVIGSTEKLNNIFFDEDKTTFTSASGVELNNLFAFLSVNKKLTVEIFTCINKKSKKPDIKLAVDRLQTVTDRLVAKGIDKDQIKTKVYRRNLKPEKKSGSETETKKESGKLKVKIIAIKEIT